MGFYVRKSITAGPFRYGTDLEDPNIAAVAQAMGLHAQRVQRPDELEGAVRAALEYDGPALIEAMVARQELSMPPTITLDQAKGFTLFATHGPVRSWRRAHRPRRDQPGPANLLLTKPIAAGRWCS